MNEVLVMVELTPCGHQAISIQVNDLSFIDQEQFQENSCCNLKLKGLNKIHFEEKKFSVILTCSTS